MINGNLVSALAAIVRVQAARVFSEMKDIPEKGKRRVGVELCMHYANSYRLLRCTVQRGFGAV
jgi:hypothetical protein